MNTAATSNAFIQWKSTQFHRSTKLLAQNLESTYRETFLKEKDPSLQIDTEFFERWENIIL